MCDIELVFVLPHYHTKPWLILLWLWPWSWLSFRTPHYYVISYRIFHIIVTSLTTPALYLTSDFKMAVSTIKILARTLTSLLFESFKWWVSEKTVTQTFKNKIQNRWLNVQHCGQLPTEPQGPEQQALKKTKCLYTQHVRLFAAPQCFRCQSCRLYSTIGNKMNLLKPETALSWRASDSCSRVRLAAAPTDFTALARPRPSTSCTATWIMKRLYPLLKHEWIIWSRGQTISTVHSLIHLFILHMPSKTTEKKKAANHHSFTHVFFLFSFFLILLRKSLFKKLLDSISPQWLRRLWTMEVCKPLDALGE